jgi:ribonuclease T1
LRLVVNESAARDARGPASSDILLRELPREASETLALIRAGGPFPYRKDGTTFQNRERLLPQRPRGYYTEYTVRTPGSRDRGARRIVAGGDPRTSGEYWYTDDHYRSVRRIRE